MDAMRLNWFCFSASLVWSMQYWSTHRYLRCSCLTTAMASRIVPGTLAGSFSFVTAGRVEPGPRCLVTTTAWDSARDG
ncbi:uncharacterized protein B0I36DRAFT_334297 [Microdochium trichocladiopsis]|uniref:Secreted protein n=1 Tax=Microdochium trichocladiopsis TaxID=1682393 RepID=A0A9P8XYG5_9PEZI|nr:uncharacterized protein B0I36DRAFT_334297 [Microdochium trichocladiopsis]KAH7021345.1 hypothetical protein B0I36DRAFT_334297 [Microdochium trichocladiopsis]